MKYFLQLVFIYVLCLSFQSPMLYAQTEEVLRESHKLIEEESLSWDHDSGETGGMLIITARGDHHIDQVDLHINIHILDAQQHERGYLSPIYVDRLARNVNGRFIEPDKQFFFYLREERVYHISIYGIPGLFNNNNDVIISVLWVPYHLVGEAEQDAKE